MWLRPLKHSNLWYNKYCWHPINVLKWRLQLFCHYNRFRWKKGNTNMKRNDWNIVSKRKYICHISVYLIVPLSKRKVDNLKIKSNYSVGKLSSLPTLMTKCLLRRYVKRELWFLRNGSCAIWCLIKYSNIISNNAMRSLTIVRFLLCVLPFTYVIDKLLEYLH